MTLDEFITELTNFKNRNDLLGSEEIRAYHESNNSIVNAEINGLALWAHSMSSKPKLVFVVSVEEED